LTKLFQDTAGETLVMADGQEVQLCQDLSGNDRHITKIAAIATGLIYKTSGGLSWLERQTDSLSQGLSRGGDTLTTLESVSAWRLLSAGSGNQSVIFNDNNIRIQTNGTNISLGGLALATPSVGEDFIVSYFWESSDDDAGIALDQDDYTTGTQADVSGAQDLFLGAWFNDASSGPECRCYAYFDFNRRLTASERSNLVTYLAAKQGRVL
jgi:hypothetical protein